MSKKHIPAKPIPGRITYMKYGLFSTEADIYICKRCKKMLNAGPNFKPRYCSNCGQKIKWEGVL